MDASLVDISAIMDSKLKKCCANQARMRSTLCAFRSKLKETIQCGIKAVIQPIRTKLDEMTTCQEATETEPNPGMMQSKEEH
jgi:hypothetical protein